MIGPTIRVPRTSVTLSFAERRIAATNEELLDRYLPKYDVREHHSIYVDASPERAYDAVLNAPLGSSLIVRALLKLRTLPSLVTGHHCDPLESADATLRDLIGHGFSLVDEQPGREIVLGTVGAFWKLTGGKNGAMAENLSSGPPPGTAAAVWNFRVSRHGRGSSVDTETRVLAGDDAARRSFARYWLVVGPFSALIRRRMLSVIKEVAESGPDALL
jgi:hypothetical protein